MNHSAKMNQSIASCKTFTLDNIEYSAIYLKPNDVKVFKSNDTSKDISGELPVDLYRGICLDFKNIFNFPLSERDSLMGDHIIYWEN
jgi:hypothetical protein